MSTLTASQSKLLEEGRLLVVSCPVCHETHVLGTLPMDMGAMVKLTRKAKCPNDREHRLIMGTGKET
ncbi:MAG: hypothetical protein JWN75_1196 [Candidatus Saccharibacteria bacterium]|nr:hypothetical protein [Candidatus Saccharibacteria bacterium]